MDDDGAGHISIYTNGTFRDGYMGASSFSFEPSGDAELEKDIAFSAVRPKVPTFTGKITLNNESARSMGAMLGFDVATGEAVFQNADGTVSKIQQEAPRQVVVPAMDSAAEIAERGENDDC